MDAQVVILLQLKADYKKLAGKDPPGATPQGKKDKETKKEAKKAGNAFRYESQCCHAMKMLDLL